MRRKSSNCADKVTWQIRWLKVKDKLRRKKKKINLSHHLLKLKRNSQKKKSHQAYTNME